MSTMVRTLTPDEEEKMRKFWKLKPDDKIILGVGGERETVFRSQMTGHQLGFSDPQAFYYGNPYYKFGGPGDIDITERCMGIDGDKACLCVDDLIELGDAVEEVFTKGPENISSEAQILIKYLREKCPKDMKRTGYAIENYPEFKEFILNGPPISREAINLFEMRRKMFPKQTPDNVEDFIKKWYK